MRMGKDDEAEFGSTEKQSNVKEVYWKILVVGEPATGKTSIIKRYVSDSFNKNYLTTIGLDFALKTIPLNDNTHLKLQLWDIGGQERHGNMTKVYYREAVAAFIVFDVTRPHTFDRLVFWKKDIDSKVTLPPDDRPIPVVLLANKCDLLPNSANNNTGGTFFKTKTEMDQYCEENNYIGWFETSAKKDVNIEQAANFLVKRLIEDQLSKNDDEKEDNNFLNLEKPPNPTPSSCC